jgi:starvation-inducible DNA-binding protein
MNVEITQQNRKQMSTSLNKLLASEYVLYTKTFKFHWNVVGKWFGPLHTLFEKQYGLLATNVDMIAERVRALDFYAYGTLTEFIEHSVIPEEPDTNPSDSDMIKILVGDHETVIMHIRQYIALSAQLNDMGTNNFLATLIEVHEKMAWMLR